MSRFITFLLILLVVFISMCAQQENEMNITENETSKTSRPYYNLSGEIFSNLPEFPDDFYSVDDKVYRLANLRELKDITEQYYKQPEFYPTFETQGIEMIKNPPPDRIGISGMGAYPGEQTFTTAKGQQFTATAFFHASWMVQTYQGMKIRKTFDAEYFSVSADPETFLLGPSYPVFDKDWAQKVVIGINVRNDTPSGRYTIGIDPGTPSEEYENLWRSIYGSRYVNAFSGIDRHYLTISIDVA